MYNKNIIFLTIVNLSNMVIGMDLTPYSQHNKPTKLTTLSKEEDLKKQFTLLPSELKKEVFIHFLNGKEWWYVDKNFLSKKGVNLISFNSTGTHLITGSRHQASASYHILTSPINSTVDRTEHIRDIKIVSFSPDTIMTSTCFNFTGTHLATASNHKAHIFDIATQKEIASFSHDTPVESICLNLTGTHLATTSWDKVHLFDIANQKAIISLPRILAIDAMCFDHTDTRFATAVGDRAYIFDIATKKIITYFLHKNTFVTAICFNPTGTHLATESCDQKTRIFDIATKKEISSFHHDSPVNSICFNPAGNHFATAAGDKIRIFARHDYTYEQVQLKNGLTRWLLIEKPDKAIDSLELLLVDVALKCSLDRAKIDRIWATFPISMQKALWRTMKYKIQLYGKDSRNCCIS